MQNKKFGAITSSQNPEEIANKVKGVVLMFSAIIPLVAAKLFGITLSANDVTSLVTEVSSIVGLIWAVYGSVLHLLAWKFKTA